MELWIILDSRNAGGIESHVLQLAEGLTKHQQQVSVIFLNDYGQHPLKDALKQRNISTVSLDGHFVTLWKKLIRESPSLLHTHGYKAGIFGRIAARLSNTPVVSTYHAGEKTSGKLAIYDWLDRQSARFANIVYAVSPEIAQRLPATCQVLDNFVDSKNLQPTTGKQFAFVGRLSHEKGADYLLQLAAQYPDYLFHLYGDGPLRSSLEEQAGNNVIFHGHINNMSSVWSSIELLIMPSRQEGLPMAALEAMARGIPVLASQVGSLNQLIDTGKNGWLIPPGDNQKLARCLGQWISTPEQDRQHLRQAARQKILNRFTTDIVVPQVINNYQKILRHSHL